MIHSDQLLHKTLGLSVLTGDQKAEIHSATLEVLRRTGVKVLSTEVREILGRAGCMVENDRVRIPTHLVEWAVRAAPRQVVLCDRKGAPAMTLGGRKSYFGTGSDTPYVIDPRSGQRRPAILEDIANVSLLVDALPNIDFIMCMGIASDVNQNISDLYHFKAMVTNTTKPVVYTAWSRRNLQSIIAMAEAVAGGESALQFNSFCALYAEPIAPLTHATESCEKLLYICRKRLPVVYTPGLITGATSPITRAGAVVQANAELLSGLVICQLISEGTPVVAGAGGMMTLDMSSAVGTYGAPEFMLDWSALCEMGHYYDLPVFGFAGVSDAKTFDQQAGIEGALWVLAAALVGGNLIHDVGYIESGLTTSYEMLVAMDETIGLVKRLIAGLTITEETLALDVIDQVGPGGHFLAEKHTVRHCRENWRPTLFDHNNREGWEAAGGQDLGQRASRRVNNILSNHRPVPLDEAVISRLDTIIGEY